MSNARDHNEQCRRLRAAPAGFWQTLKTQLARRCSDHIDSCPRCQKRLAKIGRVELALCLMRMQPHTLALLARANASTLRYLKRSLRETQCAKELSAAVPGPGRLENARPMLERLTSVAACLFVILMIRTRRYTKMSSAARPISMPDRPCSR
jgi:hypothetical protein